MAKSHQTTGADERFLIGNGLKVGYLEIYNWSSQSTIDIYERMCKSRGKRAIFCEHGVEYSTVWYSQISTTERPPEDVTNNDYNYEIRNFTIRIIVPHKKNAKTLASLLNRKLNGILVH